MYLMESEKESNRLIIKSDEAQTRSHLELVGLKQLQAGAHVIDAGCGSGFVGKIMLQMAPQIDRLSLLDQSADRLTKAQDFINDPSRVQLIQTNLTEFKEDIPAADLIFSRFVMEYIPKAAQQQVIKNLSRYLKPGGKLVLIDIDYHLMNYYPETPVSEKISEILKCLNQADYLDPYIGRKLYTHAVDAGLKDVSVDIRGHHLFYGKQTEKDLINWQEKFKQMQTLVDTGALVLDFSLPDLLNNLLSFLHDQRSFVYSPLMIVQAVKG